MIKIQEDLPKKLTLKWHSGYDQEKPLPGRMYAVKIKVNQQIEQPEGSLIKEINDMLDFAVFVGEELKVGKNKKVNTDHWQTLFASVIESRVYINGGYGSTILITEWAEIGQECGKKGTSS
jgi:outer membrane protein W